MGTKKTTLLRLGFMIGILLVSGLVFTSLAEDLVNHEAMTNLDPVLGAWLLARTSLAGDRIFSLITFMGDALIISLGTGLLGLWFAIKKHWRQLGFLLISVGGAALLNLILKNVFLRPRPDFPQAYMQDTGFSFPSGHVMISIAFYGAIAYLLFIALKPWRFKVLAVIGMMMIAALIGFSRLYLGIHYFTDVLGGWLAGGLWLAVCVLGEDLFAFTRNRMNKRISFMKPG